MWLLFEFLYLGSLIGFDLFSKWAIKSFLVTMPGQHYNLIDNILELQYAENNGASFGIFAGNQTLLIVITGITILVMISALVYFNKKPKLLRYGLLTIIGGAIGNLVDRIALGYVRDFIDYTFLKTWFGIDFAIGNIADIFCLIGLLMIIVYILFSYKEGDLKSRFKKFHHERS